MAIERSIERVCLQSIVNVILIRTNGSIFHVIMFATFTRNYVTRGLSHDHCAPHRNYKSKCCSGVQIRCGGVQIVAIPMLLVAASILLRTSIDTANARLYALPSHEYHPVTSFAPPHSHFH